MDDFFNLYVDQLRRKGCEKIDCTFSNKFLGVDETFLSFSGDVRLSGEAYLADQELVLHLTCAATAEVPCKICGESVSAPIRVEGKYFAIPLSSIPTGVFSMESLLRDSILLEAPRFVECVGGCQKRKEYERYIGRDKRHGTYRPFEKI